MAKITTGTTNGNITITPNGTGKTVVGTGAASATVQSSGDFDLVLQTGNATTGSITITDGANGDIAISPNGTGTVVVNTDLDVDNININGNAITSTDTNGNIAITPNGTGEVDITKVDIDGGTIDGVTIGGSSAGAVTTTSLVATTADIDGGTIDGTTIGGTTPAAVSASSLTLNGVSNQGFSSGTKMLFQQTAAPTGWTKDTGNNDVALRVVSGTVGSGGSVAFETAFASQTIDTHTLDVTEIPAHNHSIKMLDGTPYSPNDGLTGGYFLSDNSGITLDIYSFNGSNSVNLTNGTNNTGSGLPHGHGSINLDVSYVDVIIATKD